MPDPRSIAMYVKTIKSTHEPKKKDQEKDIRIRTQFTVIAYTHNTYYMPVALTVCVK